MKKFDHVAVLLGIGLVLAVLAAVSLVAGGVMKLFGFTYDSVGSLVLYFIFASVLSAALGQAFSALPKVLYEMGKLNRAEGIILYLVLDTLVTAVGLGVVDRWMPSVSASDRAIIVVSLLLALPGLGDFKKKQ